mmetsp:Transcript_28508/g.45854  ORF Transcript_28508/g.45854 Transcript_28508/m.45854 type:complete len:265 (+) Transcript_28508:2468-3262(+)
MAGDKAPKACGNISTSFSLPHILSMTSAPMSCKSSPSFSSLLSAAIQLSTASSNSTINKAQISNIASRHFGTFSIIFGLPSIAQQRASNACLRTSSSLWDRLRLQSIGRKCEAKQSLKKSAVSSFAKMIAESTFFSNCTSWLPASCVITLKKSGSKASNGFLLSLELMYATKPQSKQAACALTCSEASAKQNLNNCNVCSLLATRTCQIEHAISFTIHKASARTAANLDASVMILMRVGSNSGQCCTFDGLSSSSISIMRLPTV